MLTIRSKFGSSITRQPVRPTRCVLEVMPVLFKMSTNKIRVIKDNHELPILSRWLEIEKILWEDHMIQWLVLLPRMVMCHPSNRGTLGLNARNAHCLGERVKTVGADLSELHGAVCFEMSPKQDVQKKQIEFNSDLVRVSDGLLAELFGSENYLSVGGGHLVAFLRAATTRCATCAEGLADKAGNIDLNELFKDKVIEEMATKGYKWKVIHNSVESEIPDLPDFIQRALNSVNSIAAEQSELEIMVSISQFHESLLKRGGETNWAKAAEAAVAGNPPCKDYADILASYAENYGGGGGAPMIIKLDAFAKKYAANRILNFYLPSWVRTLGRQLRALGYEVAF